MGDAKILVKILGKKKERREIFLPKVGNEAEKSFHSTTGEGNGQQSSVEFRIPSSSFLQTSLPRFCK